MMTRDTYLRAGKWPAPPSYNKMFDVDRTFFSRIKASGTESIKERQANFYHQFHPGRSVQLIRRQQQLVRSTSQAQSNIEA